MSQAGQGGREQDKSGDLLDEKLLGPPATVRQSIRVQEGLERAAGVGGATGRPNEEGAK